MYGEYSIGLVGNPPAYGVAGRQRVLAACVEVLLRKDVSSSLTRVGVTGKTSLTVSGRGNSFIELDTKAAKCEL